MAKYIVGHKCRTKTVILELDDNLIQNANNGFKNSRIAILMKYKNTTNYQRYLNEAGLTIKPAVEPKNYNAKQSFAHRNDQLSHCEKRHCSYCSVGAYEKCPRNK